MLTRALFLVSSYVFSAAEYLKWQPLVVLVVVMGKTVNHRSPAYLGNEVAHKQLVVRSRRRSAHTRTRAHMRASISYAENKTSEFQQIFSNERVKVKVSWE